MRQMAQSNLAEIAAAKIALDQSTNKMVRTFAQKMLDGRMQAHKELERLAEEKDVKLPTEPDRKHRREARQLKALEGEAFDQKYMAQGGLYDHQATHRMLAKAQGKVKDPGLKAGA